MSLDGCKCEGCRRDGVHRPVPRVFPVELVIEIFRNPDAGLPWCWAVKEVAISGASVVLKRGKASRTSDAATDAQDALEIQEKAYRQGPLTDAEVARLVWRR